MYRVIGETGIGTGATRVAQGLLLTLLAAGLSACGGEVQADGQEAEAGAFRRVINVEVLPLEARGFEERIRLSGTVQANVDVVVSAEESGVVREISAQRGASVQVGQPLFRIDDRILLSQVAEAEARAALAQESWERRQRLFEVDGVGAELAYLEARYQAEQAAAVLTTLRERLDRTVVRAPIAGILENRMVEVGTMVSPGTPVARIVQVDPVKILGGVPERYAGVVTLTSHALVTVDVLGAVPTQARVRYVGATVNPSNRTFEIELVLPNPGQVLKPEMVANVEVVARAMEGVLVVPQEAIVRVEEGYVAFVVEDREGRPVAAVRALRIGTMQRNEVVVEEGLQVGDRLIVLGQNQVADGDLIEVVRTRGPEVQGGGS